ncbi:type III secretion system translocator chaperone SicA [Erwiniaceae bacterium BAC15a-03b]|uniref:Type III secretion system translocator chaperone SicA n=1 Tax=Winslowiella arboricola TaxID=2978220 RepID=A0A9J6PSF2_9GAMM|nr:type III secretion system translocator chaperone SicA [Winslowiella arboricola]MCU5773758.1 type III secretion system translocator chaperone SicA [Winslowiella arboricola]MCU5777668.1 type III secretion system translocator chaperone SicA [Winslowiella arboricola]
MTQESETIHEAEMCSMLLEYVQQGVLLKDLQGIPDDTMEDIYAHAHHFYYQGRLDEAEHYFSLLCMYDLKNPDYFIGLGAVNQLKKKYQKACDLYSLAYILAKEDYSPIFYGGQCQLLMGDVIKALQLFEVVIKKCPDQELVKKARVYFETIKKNRSLLSKDNATNQGLKET